MSLIAVQEITLAGLEMTTEAATKEGDTFINDGRTVYVVTDTGTTAPVVTVASGVNCNQGFDHDIAVTVESGETRYIGPFPTSRFNNSANLVTVTMDDDVSVVVSAIKI